MAKKIKRRENQGASYVDPRLEEVDEDRAFEMELDEETEEAIFVHHYRRKWGDEFDADIEHVFNMEETNKIVVVLLNMMETIKKKHLVEKSLVIPPEGNPMQTN